jgi:methylamine---glutamate N-methyltransferase subunit A
VCGIVAFWDKSGGPGDCTGKLVLAMLAALGCRGPDSAGMAVIGPRSDQQGDEIWKIRFTGRSGADLSALARLGQVVSGDEGQSCRRQGQTEFFRFHPNPGVTAAEVELALGARAGGLEVLSIGRRLDLVKQVGAPAALESTYSVSSWCGPLAIGHTRMSTESRIDLGHSQPFWAHGVPDLATVHNGHITNYHQLRRRYEQQGSTFFTDNDSEVIGVYLRGKLNEGCSLPEALSRSIVDLDGSFNYLVISADGLGIVRDRFGFKPLVLAETELFVAVATEEVALRRALPGDYTVTEPPPATALFFPLESPELVVV